MRQFVQAGGSVLVTGPSGQRDGWLFAREQPPWETGFDGRGRLVLLPDTPERMNIETGAYNKDVRPIIPRKPEGMDRFVQAVLDLCPAGRLATSP